MKKILIFFGYLCLSLAALSAANAQNVQCPTRPAGDSTNACASTAFVQGGIKNGLPVATTSQLYGGSGIAGQANAVNVGSGLSLSGGTLTATGGNTAQVANVAALAAGNFSAYSTINLAGYATTADGGQGILIKNGTATTDHCTVFNDSAGNAFYRSDYLSVIGTSYCGVVTYSPGAAAANVTALGYWWSAVQASATAAGYIQGNIYFNSGLSWDFGTRWANGVKIFGDGMQVSKLIGTQTSGVCVQMLSSASGNVSYYETWADFQIVCPTSGVVAAWGRLNGNDSFQSYQINNVSIINSQNNLYPSSVAAQFNGLLTGTVNNFQCGNYVGPGGTSASGTACMITALAMTTFNNMTTNGNIGLYITTNGGSTVFPVYSNVWNTVDIENSKYGVLQDAATAFNNTFKGGTAYSSVPGGSVIAVSNCATSLPGGCIVFDGVAMNTGFNTVYGSPPTNPFVDPVNNVGVQLRSSVYGMPGAPSFPASGTPYWNNSGQTEYFSISPNGATITAITQYEAWPNNSNGYRFVGSISGTTLTVASIAAGTLPLPTNMYIRDVENSITVGTKVNSSSGSTATLNNSQTISSRNMYGYNPVGVGTGLTTLILQPGEGVMFTYTGGPPQWGLRPSAF